MPIIQSDYTTLMGASNALDLDEIRKNGFTLSSLLNLSQFIETFVLNNAIQYEYGQSDEWEPYRKAFENKILGRYILKEVDVFKKVQVQVDENENIVSNVIKEIINKEITESKVRSLDYAIRFRQGTYSAITSIIDQSNPVIERYLKIAKDTFTESENKKLELYIQKLKNSSIGNLGIFIEARIKFIQNYIQNQNVIYNPHFSRQPLISNDLNLSIHSWNMEQLTKKRNELIETNDSISNELSPIFIACLSKAQKPIDIFYNAINLRNTNYMSDYRATCDKITDELMNGDSTNLVLYKANIRKVIADINESILTNDIIETKKTQFELKLDVMPIGAKYIVEQSEKIKTGVGIKTYTMFTNVLKDSIGITGVLEKLKKVYDQDFIFDTSILTSFNSK